MTQKHTLNKRKLEAFDYLLTELRLIEEGWAVRERGLRGTRRLNQWERERLMFLRDAIAKATSSQAR